VSIEGTADYATQNQQSAFDKALKRKGMINLRDWTTFGHNPGSTSATIADKANCV
jgi:hypothetical protein